MFHYHCLSLWSLWWVFIYYLHQKRDITASTGHLVERKWQKVKTERRIFTFRWFKVPVCFKLIVYQMNGVWNLSDGGLMTTDTIQYRQSNSHINFTQWLSRCVEVWMWWIWTSLSKKITSVTVHVKNRMQQRECVRVCHHFIVAIQNSNLHFNIYTWSDETWYE